MFTTNILIPSLAFSGAVALLCKLFSLVSILIKSTLYMLKKNKDDLAYAVVTGASDGIGKEIGLELARKGYNLILIARTKAALDEVAALALTLNPLIKTKTISFDFATGNFQQLDAELSTYKITLLVNNVGISHDIPTPFALESPELLDRMININIKSLLKLTHPILNRMISLKTGIIVNVGSFSGIAPSPFLGVYGASKAFVKSWSVSLSRELVGTGVKCQHLNTFFVATKMAKMGRGGFVVPSPQVFARSAVAGFGGYMDRTPYFVHAWVYWAVSLMSEEWITYLTGRLLAGIRQKALKKREREATKTKKV